MLRKLAVMLITVLFFTGCEENLLTEPVMPESVVPEETVNFGPASLSKAIQGVVGIAYTPETIYVGDSVYFEITVPCSVEVGSYIAIFIRVSGDFGDGTYFWNSAPYADPIRMSHVYTKKGTYTMWIRAKYIYGPYGRITSGPLYTTRVNVLLETIPATIDIDPDTLNLVSRGKRITCYLKLAEEYDVGDVNVSTVELSTEKGTVSAQLKPTKVGDHDADNISDLMVKFDRSAVQDILEIGDEEITVTGELTNGTPFEGSDTITVISGPA